MEINCLRKIELLTIPKDNPFKNDILGLKPYCDNLSKLVSTITQPFVISIEALWGYGKTTFVNLWKADLENNKYLCLYFNAWETDFYDDPLIAFISEIQALFQGRMLEHQDDQILNPLQELINAGEKIANISIPLIVKSLSMGLVDKDTFDEFKQILVPTDNTLVKKYLEQKENIKLFKDKLQKLICAVGRYKDFSLPVIVFIDELDRCKPDYSLLFLERIKHLFNIEGMVFVLSIDRAQLENSIKTVYGDEIEVDGYLRKFIDLRFALPKPNNSQYYEYLCKYYLLWDFISKKRPNEFERNLPLIIAELFNITKLSLREMDQLFLSLNLFMRTSTSHIDWILLTIILLIKVKKPSTYFKLSTKSIDISNIITEITEIDNWEKLFDSSKENFELYIAGRNFLQCLIDNFSSSNDFDYIRESLLKLGFSREYLNKVFEDASIRHDNRLGGYNSFQSLIQVIEMQNSFKVTPES